jgi:1,4-dihydroxy-6-naphthoate synthase
MKLSLGFSPCPNDCFMFDAIVNRRIDAEGLEFAVHLADVEQLNDAALAGQAQITKLSYHAYAHCVDRYVLLDAGSALGRNCGPLLISARRLSIDDVAGGGLRIAIPGQYTTANFLLGLACPGALDKTELLFSEIESAIGSRRLIIHENRFTYEAKGLKRSSILGSSGRRDRRADSARRHCHQPAVAGRGQGPVNRVVRRSVEHAFAHRSDSLPFVRARAGDE